MSDVQLYLVTVRHTIDFISSKYVNRWSYTKPVPYHGKLKPGVLYEGQRSLDGDQVVTMVGADPLELIKLVEWYVKREQQTFEYVAATIRKSTEDMLDKPITVYPELTQ